MGRFFIDGFWQPMSSRVGADEIPPALQAKAKQALRKELEAVLDWTAWEKD